jgi:hypothetical protein
MYSSVLLGGAGVAVGATANGDVVVWVLVTIFVVVVDTEVVVVAPGEAIVSGISVVRPLVPLGSLTDRLRPSNPLYVPDGYMFGITNGGIVIVIFACD